MKQIKKVILTFMVVVLCSGSVWAADFDLTGVVQPEFNQLVTEAGRLTAYRSMMPAEPGGLTGFDIGLAITGVEVNEGLWTKYNVDTDVVAVPRLMVQKGLPAGIDIGAFYAEVSDYDLSMEGAQIQWALLEGTAATPALALRGSYTKLDAAGEMEVKTMAADIVVSKGVAMLTPYAGLGTVSYEGEYTGSNAGLQALLSDYDDNETRIFGGVQFAVALLNITAEYEQMDEPVYSVKMSLGW